MIKDVDEKNEDLVDRLKVLREHKGNVESELIHIKNMVGP